MTSAGLPFAESSATRKPLGQMTCADFLASEDAAKPEIVYWAAIHDRGGRRVIGVIDVDDTDRIVPVVVQKCRTAPEASLWQQVMRESGTFGKQALEQRE